MEQFKVALTGISPLLMNAWPKGGAEKQQAEKNLKLLSPRERAEMNVYRTDDGELFLPAYNLHRALIAGATFTKGKGRASLQREVACGLMLSPNELRLGVHDYAIAEHRAVISATRGAVTRHRARIDTWSTTVDVSYDPGLLNERQIRKVFKDTGERVGVLDFRPEKKGPFGRFVAE